MTTDHLIFYKGRRFRVGSQKWRWRYESVGNYKKMANGGEAYGDLEYVMKSAFRVCGLVPTGREDFEGMGEVMKREGGTEVRVRVEY